MFAGHLGAALVASRIEPRVNVGVFATASLLLDILLWLFVLLGWESVEIAADFARTHQPRFTFAYSHGLVASLVWSTLAGALVLLWARQRKEIRWRASLLVAAVVFSHWLLDALVHRAEMPLAGPGSTSVGAGLWDHMAVALVVEAALVAAGVFMLLSERAASRRRQLALGALCLLVLAFTVAGMTVAPPPPSAAAMAATSLATIALVCALAGWLGRRPCQRPALGGTF